MTTLDAHRTDSAFKVHDHTVTMPAVPFPKDKTDWDAIAHCHQCGLSLLRRYVRSSDWVVRRVENIEFIDDRTVRRRMSVDYTTPEDTVVFSRSDDVCTRVIPVTMMRRKSLTNFDLRGQDGRALPLLGLRETQALTLSILRVWADKALQGAPVARLTGEQEAVLEHIVTGDQAELTEAYKALEAAAAREGDPLGRLWRDEVFSALLERLAQNFILFTLDDAPPLARRIVKFACDEPLTLRYATATYRGHRKGPCPGSSQDERPQPNYGYGEEKLAWYRREPALAALGFTPTLIRFPVPAAELTTSFHFEITAPPEVSIVEASLLAGLPNLYMPGHQSDPAAEPDPEADKRAWADPSTAPVGRRRRPSFDSVVGGYPTVDLHVVDVPVGSLSRAQVALQASPKGWLGTAVVATWIAFLTLMVFGFGPQPQNEAATTLLMTFTAAMVGALVRPDPHRMVTRLLSGARLFVGLSAVLTLAAAFVIASVGFDAAALVEGLALASLVPALVVSWSWWCCHRRLAREKLPSRVRGEGGSRQDGVRTSPWEQHAPHEEPDPKANFHFHVDLVEELEAADYPFDHATRKFGFDKPAIKVASAEGARKRFRWNDAFATAYEERLK